MGQKSVLDGLSEWWGKRWKTIVSWGGILLLVTVVRESKEMADWPFFIGLLFGGFISGCLLAFLWYGVNDGIRGALEWGNRTMDKKK